MDEVVYNHPLFEAGLHISDRHSTEHEAQYCADQSLEFQRRYWYDPAIEL